MIDKFDHISIKNFSITKKKSHRQNQKIYDKPRKNIYNTYDQGI